MRFSVELIPEHPLDDLLATIELADELGFYGCYVADEIWHKDAWQLLAAAAGRTERIRLALGVTHVTIKDPAFAAQQIATLDELSGGRAEAGLGIGNVAMLEQYGIDWKATRPLSRLREAHHVVRTLLDEGALDLEGEFYTYHGLTTAARPVREHVPVTLGAMRGPRTFELSGEIADGVHVAGAHSLDALGYAAHHVAIGAKRAGRDVRDLELGANLLAAIAPDPVIAQQAARVMAAFYIPAAPPELVERHGVQYQAVRPAVEAFVRGDLAKAIALTTPEIARRLSLSGSPSEWIVRLTTEIAPSGFDHVVLTLADRYLVERWTSSPAPEIPTLEEQLRLIHEHVMPSFTEMKEAIGVSAT